ncbi:MAG TPA: isoprenylcysteine carboxylmethyltransferase family protein [Verrucomicrobiae bacterium]|nr:isoprenylcysteine carboxylmethyltransferase family protein [Verrucomicrobiae bacterium]
MSGSAKIITGCWLAFIVYWAISAWWGKRVAERQSWTAILANRVPTFVGALLLFLRKLPYPLQVQVLPHSAATADIGAVLCVLGVLSAIWSRIILGRNWSSDVVFKQNHELIERGPYRFVRHPIYTSILTMCLGSALAVNRLGSWLGLPLLLVGFWIKSRQEEALLTRHFPAEYPAYQQRVKALIPFIF